MSPIARLPEFPKVAVEWQWSVALALSEPLSANATEHCLNISKMSHFDILRYNFLIKNIHEKTLSHFGPKNKTWPKLKKYDI